MHAEWRHSGTKIFWLYVRVVLPILTHPNLQITVVCLLTERAVILSLNETFAVSLIIDLFPKARNLHRLTYSIFPYTSWSAASTRHELPLHWPYINWPAALSLHELTCSIVLIRADLQHCPYTSWPAALSQYELTCSIFLTQADLQHCPYTSMPAVFPYTSWHAALTLKELHLQNCP
jgi:hypothetical protein